MKDYVSYMTKEQIERTQAIINERHINKSVNELMGDLIQLIEKCGTDNVKEWLKSCEIPNF